MLRRLLWAGYWTGLLLLFSGLNAVALAAPPTVTDTHNRSCASASQLYDAILGTVGPWIGPAIMLGIVGVQYAGDRMVGVLHQSVNIVGQHGMAFVIAASSITLGGIITTANGVAACP
jgi:hypothetical protein